MNGPATEDALIAALHDPAAYPHPVHSPVQVIETHVSWVVLTGPYAYKIKKPVRLSFLDYSTLERRREFCAEEVRLNGRHAPDLYLGTVPICGSRDRPRVDGTDGPIVEYAVRMVQFDRREELDALLAREAVAAGELSALGSDLARLHAEANCAPEGSDYGTAARAHRVTLDNFTELDALHLPDPLPRQLVRLRSVVADSYARREAALSLRRAAGRVRECHGDLHCANVVRWRGRLVPFDGIEFDPGLRFIDVANDVAFLTMDLAVRGRADLRHAVLQAWCEALGDFAAVALLPYFESYRALVRAKVAGLQGRQHAASSPEATAALARLRRYLDWALAQAARKPPVLILTCGLSGSGKTWLARQLAPELRALHLRSDIERKRLAGLTALADSRSPPDGGLYTREFNAFTYGRLLDCARDCLLGGESVIVDAAFLRRDERMQMLAAAASLGRRAHIVQCTAPMPVLRERVAARRRAGNDPSEADVSLLERQPTYWEPLAPEEQAITITIETQRPDAVERALQDLHVTIPPT